MSNPDPIDEFMASLRPATDAELFSGSEPVPAAPAAPAATPAPEVPAASVPAIVADVLNTTAEAALAELIRRVAAIEAYLRRNGADL